MKAKPLGTATSLAAVLFLLVLFAFETIAWSQDDAQDSRNDPMGPTRRRFETYGRFGVRTYAAPASPEQSTMFPNSGRRDPITGQYRDDLPPSNMFPYAINPREAAALRAQRGGGEGLPILIPEGRPIAEVQPYAASDLPPAAVTGRPAEIPTEIPWRPYPTAEEIPFRSQGTGSDGQPQTTGQGEEVWMRGGATAGEEGGPQPLPPGYGAIDYGADAGSLPMAGPGRTATRTAVPSIQAEQLERDQQTALRLARKVVYTPGVNAVSAVTVTFRNGTATIQGAVGSQQSRRLAEEVLYADADVRVVQNLLTVFERREGVAPAPVRGQTPELPTPPATGTTPVAPAPNAPATAEETPPIAPAESTPVEPAS